MACRSGKIEHATRAAADEAMKRVVYDNHVRGRDALSAGLNVYPCDGCGAWHFGHLPQTPSAYHYDLVEVLDEIVSADALVPPKPIKLSKHAKRQTAGGLLASLLGIEEMSSMTWFTWDGAWDFSCAPHPGVFLNLSPDQRHKGVMRLAVPAFAAKLRWQDYVERNKLTRKRRAHFTTKGNPAQWLATDAAVPLSTFRSIEVWHRGAWTPVSDVDADDFDCWLAEQASVPR